MSEQKRCQISPARARREGGKKGNGVRCHFLSWMAKAEVFENNYGQADIELNT